MESVKLELNASRHGWNCSKCGLFIDCIGRPILGNELITVDSKGIAWIENRPKYNFCPNCGKPFRGDSGG